MSSFEERKAFAVKAFVKRYNASRDPRERHALHALQTILTNDEVVAVCVNDDIANVKAHELCREFQISVRLIEPTLRGKKAAGIDISLPAELVKHRYRDDETGKMVEAMVETDKQWALYALAEDGEIVHECCVKGTRTRDGSFDVYYQTR